MTVERLFSVRNWRRAWLAIFLIGSFSLAVAETTPTPSPRAKAGETAKKKKKKSSPRPTPKPSRTPAAKKKKASDDEEATPAPAKKKKGKTVSAAEKKRAKASASASAKASAKKEEIKKEAAKLDEPSLPSATPTPSLSPTPLVIQPSGVPQVNIEKSGYLGEQGYEPPPTPEKKRGWWFWSKPEVTYRYLSRSVRAELDRAPVMRRRWQFLVVHNSGTKQGSARIFDYYHKHVRRMQNGLAYHFVIGNGTSTGDGEIEIGDRWRRQINGGHVHSDYLNNIALGICLVGDFNRSQPTPRQLEACEELIRYLRKRCGKTDHGDIIVRPHREVNPPQWATDCPGDDFPYTWFRRF